MTISHECGTQGTAVARRVAERLGFSCWDNEIVTEIARLLHTDEATITAFDERSRGAIEDLIGTSLFSPDIISADYTDHVRLIIDSLARRGRSVIVGRSAQFQVDPNHALRVRLVAPFEHRARVVETQKGISFDEAKRIVESADRERAAFVHHATGKDVADAGQYDIVINTKSYSGECADALVLVAYLSKFGELPRAEHTQKSEAQGSVGRLRLTAKYAGDK
jgi:cytidylate kinase